MIKALPIFFGLLSFPVLAQDLAAVAASAAPAPHLELVSFEARVNGPDGVVLIWATLSERNGDQFLVERSQDLANWQAVTEVAGHGTPGEHTPYEAQDPTPLPGVSYYRLVDPKASGEDRELSDLFSVRTTAVDNLWITPDQRPGSFVVAADGRLDDVRLSDNRGQFIPMSIHPMGGSVLVNVELLPPGTYYLQASVDGTPRIKPVFITSNGIIGG